MKKIILSVAVITLIGMTSCKKDRTCTCTETVSSQTVNGVTQTLTQGPTKTESKVTKVKKGGIDCNSGEQTVSYSAVFGGTPYTIVQTSKNDCTLD